MSSTLQNQLARLHGANNATRRHEEAVGRGINHSVNIGHAVSSASAKFKPSILYPDARAAADISVATIREDGIAALRQLEVLTGNDTFTSHDFLHGLFGPQSVQLERRRLTKVEWQPIHSQISSLLYRLATAHDTSSSSSSCVLRVLEYLIRRYDIHSSKETAHLLLLTCLPQHETPFFARILQLVDLTSVPIWTWLRPYAAVGAPPLSRTALALRASKDDALLVQLLQFAKEIALLQSSSRILSFVGATVAEGLSKQARVGEKHSTLSEQTVRNILPFVLSACGGDDDVTAVDKHEQLFIKCPEWRGFGFILTTVLSENGGLGLAAREVVAVTMAKGSLLMDDVFYKENNDEDALEAATDSLLAMLAFLIQTNNYGASNNENVVGVRLLTAPKPRNSTEEEPITIIGCEMPRSTFLALCRHRLLASAFGNAVEGRNINVTAFLAAILGRALSYLSNAKDGKRLGSRIIQSLAEESGLRRLWRAGKKHTLAASVAAEIVSLFADSPSESDMDNYKDSLIAIQRASRSGCDHGVATAVSAWHSKDTKGKENIRMLLTNTFGAANMAEEKTVTSCSSKNNSSSEWINYVPPRIALEHSDAPVRLAAIQKLVNEARMEHLTQNNVKEDDEGLAAALLRRAAVDDNVQVAVAALSAFFSLESEELITYMPSPKEAISMVHRWSTIRKSSVLKKNTVPSNSSITEDHVHAICGAINLCAMASKAPLSETDLKFLIQCIAVHSTNDELKDEFDKSLSEVTSEIRNKLQETIHEALIIVMEVEASEEISPDQTTEIILASSIICRDILRSIVQSSQTENEQKLFSIQNEYISNIQNRFVRVVMTASYSIFQEKSFKLDYQSCLTIQSAFPQAMDHKKLLMAYITSPSFSEAISAVSSEVAIKFVQQLASKRSSGMFKNLCVPAIEEISSVYRTACGSEAPNLLLEVCTTPSTGDESITRLLQLVREKVSSLSFNAGELVLVLSLLSHSHRSVRKGALELLSETAMTGTSIGADISLVSKITISSMKAKLELGGANALVDFLKECVLKSESPNSFRMILFNQCVLCTVGEHGSRAKSLPSQKFAGSFTAASILLNAMEDAGDSVFSLNERWDSCGKLIFDTLMGQDLGDEIVQLEQPLAESVVRMLKGVIVYDMISVNLVTGPSGRSRSYSVGNADDVAWMKQYPKSMSRSIIDCLASCLSLGRMTYVARSTLRLVLSRQSWTNHIFAHLSDKIRRQIVLALMQVKEFLNDQEAGFALFELPLKAEDFIHLLRTEDSANSFKSKLVSLTQLSECIGRRAQKIETAKLLDLVTILFQRLAFLSAATDEDNVDDGLGYTRLSLLQTLNSLCREYKKYHDEYELFRSSSGARRRSRSRSSSFSCSEKETSPALIVSFAELLVGLLGSATARNGVRAIRPLESTQARSIAVTLLSVLCTLDHESSSRCLPSALDSLVSSCSDRNIGNDNLELVSTVTKAILDLADASTFSAVNLLRSFAWNCRAAPLSSSIRERTYQSFIRPLVNLPDEHVGKAIASLLAVSLAVSAFGSTLHPISERENNGKHAADPDTDPLSVKFCVQLLRELSPRHQMSATFELLAYAGNLMSILGRSGVLESREEHHDETSDNVALFYVTCTELLDAALTGSDDSRMINTEKEYSANEIRCAMLLTTSLLTMVRDGLLSPTVKKVIRSSEEGAGLCLNVWKELMQLQVASSYWRQASRGLGSSNTAIEKEFWRAAPEAIHNCLATLQRLLPVPHFLASVLTQLKEEDVDASVRKHATTLLGERSAEVDPESYEFLLFVEVIPELVDVCVVVEANLGELDRRKTVVLHQSALMAIECLVQSLFATGRKSPVTKMQTAILLSSLGKTSIIAMESAQRCAKDFNEARRYMNNGSLFSSAILCSATLVSVLNISALPQLKCFVDTLIQQLQSINRFKKLNAEENKLASGETAESLEVLDLMHWSTIRGLIASIEALPQFFAPYLSDLLHHDAVPSWSMRRDAFKSEAIQRSAERLHQSLATKIPARQLLPAVQTSITKSFHSNDIKSWREIQTIVQLMTLSLKASSRADLAMVLPKTVGTLMMVYTYSGEEYERFPLLETCNEALLALVLKMSESQLHSLYARMREWKGDLDVANLTAVSARKRYAFWSITAALAKELRALFLPCLSSVVMDVVGELVSFCTLPNDPSLKCHKHFAFSIPSNVVVAPCYLNKKEFVVSKVCPTAILKKTKHGKRQKVSLSSGLNEPYDIEQIRPLQQILLGLEFAMKADAHEGGGWSRADEGQRFQLLLSPLGKLLQAEVPVDLPVRTNSENLLIKRSAFDKLVLGLDTSECGNVAGCLTAMAAAAGNEQLWKPLNHTVLQACGNDERSEVRKVGVMTLLSLMRTVGEEYMVLLPECLPVLSELLEDENEDISATAKECISLGEELLGEGLEDSLR